MVGVVLLDGTAMVLLELDENVVAVEVASVGEMGLDLAAGIVSKCRITFNEAAAFWQQGYLPPQAISPQWELFQCSSSIEYPWVFKM